MKMLLAQKMIFSRKRFQKALKEILLHTGNFKSIKNLIQVEIEIVY